jgi:hypothetical protein
MTRRIYGTTDADILNGGGGRITSLEKQVTMKSSQVQARIRFLAKPEMTRFRVRAVATYFEAVRMRIFWTMA